MSLGSLRKLSIKCVYKQCILNINVKRIFLHLIAYNGLFVIKLNHIYIKYDVLLWTPTYGQAKAGRPARTYIQQLCEDTECSPEDLPEAMNDREKWRERVRDIRASGTTWWWWWWWWLVKRGFGIKQPRMIYMP